MEAGRGPAAGDLAPSSGPTAGAATVDGSALGLLLLPAAGSHDALDRSLRSCLLLEEDDFVSELPLSIHPRERPDWEETISAMARSAEVPELSGDPPLRSCGSTASMKVKNVKKLSFTKGHFPKLAECAHFHYENVDFGTIQLSLAEEQNEVTRNGQELKELVYLVQICCQGRSWIVKRSYEDCRILDKHLHLCIYDRRFSQLAELPRFDGLKEQPEVVSQMLTAYLSRLSAIADNKINCGPVLTWMEIDNKGNHLLVHEESSINVPAIAAAHVIKRYIAQASDELSFEVGDIVSVIDMPPKEDTTWWRGKHGFQVGFFPSECVELINDKVPQSVTNCVPKPDMEMDCVKQDIKQDNAWTPRPQNQTKPSSVSKKHGKLITFLRTFMKSRPSKQKLKQRGILRERVFGCDLGEHLLNSGHDVPQVLRSCTEFIEKHGVVDGIYRLSGIASNIQKLRHEFDSEQIPDLTKDVYIQDIHCVGSLCKLYFRELPNPLLTYQLYEKFSEAVSAATDEERLIKIHDVIQQLPPPHYRTLEFLMRHLSRLATFSYVTNMHSKNLAIVWAPNLLRSKQIESACFSGTAAFMEVRIQSVVVEFILNHVDVLFSPKLSLLIREGTGHGSLSRPKSLLVSSPSTKLLTLEEAQARTQAQINSPVTADSKYIEVGEGPAALQGKFHTIIEFPTERKRAPSKAKKSPAGSWRSFFNLGRSSSVAKRKLQRNRSEPNELKSMALAGGRSGDSGTLRSAKSEESLSSLHNVEGEVKMPRKRRPRSSSDALSASFSSELREGRQHCSSFDDLPRANRVDDDGPLRVPALISPPCSAEDVDLSPPDMGMASLDFDPMSFQCSEPTPTSAHPSPEPGRPTSPRTSDSAPAPASPETPDSPETNLPSLGLVAEETLPAPSSITQQGSPVTTPTHPSSPPPAATTPSHGSGVPVDSNPPNPLASPAYTASDLSPSGTVELRLAGEGLGTAAPFADITESAPNQQGAVLVDTQPEVSPECIASLRHSPSSPKEPTRILALALAESAQQATVESERRTSGPPTPATPDRPFDPPTQTWTATFDTAPPLTATAPSPSETTPAEDWTTTSNQQSKVTEGGESPAAPIASSNASTSPSKDRKVSSASATLSTPHAGQHVDHPSRMTPPRGSPERISPGAAQSYTSVRLPTLAREHRVSPPQDTEIQAPESIPCTTPTKPTEPLAAAKTPPPNFAPVSTPLHAAETLRETSTAIPARTEPVALPPAYSAPPPAPPTRSMKSRLAAAALSGSEAANASNYHAVPAEASVAASVEEVPPHPPPPPRKSSHHQPPYFHQPKAEGVTEPQPPEAYYQTQAVPTVQSGRYRAESVPPLNPWASKPDAQILYNAYPDGRYATLGPRSLHQSLKSQGHLRGEYPPCRHPRQGYIIPDGVVVYPAIRRVQSLHTAPAVVQTVPGLRPELPLEDEVMYCQQPVYQYKAVYRPPPVPPSQGDYHVTQLQPYFENGRVQYRYSPYSGSHPPDGPCFEPDPYGTVRFRHSRNPPFPPPLVRAGGKAAGYHYLSRHVLPLGKEHSFISRDMPPSSGPKAGVSYVGWDLDESDRLYMHSLRRESRARQRAKGHTTSLYEDVAILDAGAPEIRHLRSKSDPGNALLMVLSQHHHPVRHPPLDTELPGYPEQDWRYRGNGPADRQATRQSAFRASQHAPGKLDLSHPDLKSEPTEHRHSGRHRKEELPEGRSHPPRYERPDMDRHTGRGSVPPGYPEEDPQMFIAKASVPPKSQTMREHSHYPHLPQEGAERGSHLSQCHGKWPGSHYDNLDDYHPAPHQQTAHSRGGAGHFPSSGFTPSHGNRTFSTALGQGAFLPAELSLQRPETEIRAE